MKIMRQTKKSTTNQRLSTTLKKKLHQLATKARVQAYAPYSKYQVGASVLFNDGHIETGCNIENVSYGGTVCAERVAIWSGIRLNKQRTILAVCIVTDESTPWPPCGLCCQVINEFQIPNQTIILIANTQKIVQESYFAQLMPQAFSPNFLKKRKKT